MTVRYKGLWHYAISDGPCLLGIRYIESYKAYEGCEASLTQPVTCLECLTKEPIELTKNEVELNLRPDRRIIPAIKSLRDRVSYISLYQAKAILDIHADLIRKARKTHG